MASMVLAGCGELLRSQREKSIQEARLVELEKQYHDYRNKYYQVVEQLKEREVASQTQINELQQELVELKKEIQKREDDLTAQNAELEFALKEKERELELKEAKYTATLNSLNSQLASSQQEIESLKSDQAQTTRRLADTEEEKQSCEQRIESLLSEIQSLKSLIAEQTKEIEERSVEIVSLKEQNDDLEALRKQLDARIATLTKEKESLLAKTPIPPVQGDLVSRELKEKFPLFKQAVSQTIDTDKASLTIQKRGIVITILSDNLFEKSTVILSDEGKKIVDALVTEIKKLDISEIYVEGHTDTQPLQDLPFFDNWALGSARSTNVVRYMIEQGVNPALVKSVSGSYFHPVASNTTPEGRLQNRRVEIIVR